MTKLACLSHRIQVLSFTIVLGMGAVSAWAAHPIVSDDTGTQGQGHWQYELSHDWGREKDSVQAVTRIKNVSTTLTYGLREDWDLALTLGHDHDSDAASTHSGLGDMLVQSKWRFAGSAEGWSMAFKPALSLPTGSASKGFGTGHSTLALGLLAQYASQNWRFLANAGWQWNRNQLAQREHIWSSSLAALYSPQANWTIMADWALQRTPDLQSQRFEQQLTLGLAWHPTPDWDWDVGYRSNLRNTEAARSIGLGMAYRW